VRCSQEQVLQAGRAVTARWAGTPGCSGSGVVAEADGIGRLLPATFPGSCCWLEAPQDGEGSRLWRAGLRKRTRACARARVCVCVCAHGCVYVCVQSASESRSGSRLNVPVRVHACSCGHFRRYKPGLGPCQRCVYHRRCITPSGRTHKRMHFVSKSGFWLPVRLPAIARNLRLNLLFDR
jgi:hypothetical protein